MSCVYMHRNKINGKVYIGKTDGPIKVRWGKGKPYKGCPFFYHAIQKYGWDNFEHIILLDGLTKDQANEFERMFIYAYDSTNKGKGYNIQEGGTYSSSLAGGLALAEKKRRPVCQYDINGNLICEFRGANEAARILYGKKRDSGIVQVCNGIGATAHGYVWRYKGDDFNKYDVINKMQKTIVDQYEINGDFIRRFFSLTEAEQETGASHGDILRCCKKERKSAGGYAWRYVNG